MLIHRNPDDIAKPGSRYTMCVEIPAGARQLFISGQVGANPDGTVAQGFDAQCERAFTNLLACLKSAGMDKTDLVRLNIFLTSQADVPAFRTIRDRLLAPVAPASTLIVVAGLATPAWLVEIEAVAAKA
ncbi:MAG: RidA family protein [Alphaproteobacteria bacterium]|nr:RidA family protein [Alphaproteobacteria bacterium]